MLGQPAGCRSGVPGKTAQLFVVGSAGGMLPTFSLGRTQELQRLLAGRDLPEAPIYMGGMGERITTVYSDWSADSMGP